MDRPTFSFEFDNTFGLALDSVEHKVQVFAQNFSPFHYVRGTWREINMKIENIEAPFVILFAPESGDVVDKKGFMADRVRVQIGFFDKVNREAYAEDNMAVQQAMRAAAMIFIQALNESSEFEPITKMPYRFYSEVFTCNASGVVFTLDVQGLPQCVPSTLE